MAERVGLALLRRYKPEAFPMQYIYGNPNTMAQVECKDCQQYEDSSVQIVAKPNMVCQEVQSISSTEATTVRHHSLFPYALACYGSINGRQIQKMCCWYYLYD